MKYCIALLLCCCLSIARAQTAESAGTGETREAAIANAWDNYLRTFFRGNNCPATLQLVKQSLQKNRSLYQIQVKVTNRQNAFIAGATWNIKRVVDDIYNQLELGVIFPDPVVVLCRTDQLHKTACRLKKALGKKGFPIKSISKRLQKLFWDYYSDKTAYERAKWAADARAIIGVLIDSESEARVCNISLGLELATFDPRKQNEMLEQLLVSIIKFMRQDKYCVIFFDFPADLVRVKLTLTKSSDFNFSRPIESRDGRSIYYIDTSRLNGFDSLGHHLGCTPEMYGNVVFYRNPSLLWLAYLTAILALLVGSGWIIWNHGKKILPKAQSSSLLISKTTSQQQTVTSKPVAKIKRSPASPKSAAVSTGSVAVESSARPKTVAPLPPVLPALELWPIDKFCNYCPVCETDLTRQHCLQGKAVYIPYGREWQLLCRECLAKLPQAEPFGDYQRFGELSNGIPHAFGKFYLARRNGAVMDDLKALQILPAQRSAGRPGQWETMLERIELARSWLADLPDNRRLCLVPEPLEDHRGSHLLSASPYISGLSLSRVLKKQHKIEWQKVVRLGRRLAAILAIIHASGLAHRDLKPQHILCTLSGEVLLTGVAFVKDIELQQTMNQLTQQGAVGTPAYMAPEQAECARVGSKKKVTWEVDLWALGVTLYQCLSGMNPLQLDQPVTTAQAICNYKDKMFNRWEFDAAWPEELVKLLRRCLRREPKQRGTAEQLCQDLAKIK